MVNYWAVLAAAIVTMIIGFIWYGPLFGKQWMKLAKVPKKKPKGDEMAKGMLFGLINTFVMVAILAFVLDGFPWNSFGHGLFIAGCLWLGFVATTTMGNVLWEKRPFELWLLNNAYSLVTMLISAVIYMWMTFPFTF